MTVEPEPVVRRQRSTAATSKQQRSKQERPKQRPPRRPTSRSDSGGSSASGSRGARTAAKAGGSKQTRSKAAGSRSAGDKAAGAKPPKAKRTRVKPGAKGPTGSSGGLGAYLLRPSTSGPKVRLGILWFIAAVGAITIGRWAVMALWAAAAATAAWQMSKVWAHSDRAVNLPSWTPQLAAGGAILLSASAGVGTSLAGLALIVVPILVVGIVMVSGRKPAAAGAAVIGMVLAAIPAISVILIARSETWAAIFLVVAVSFYDAGYFIGAAESSSRLEGPVTGAIGLLAVTFAASAFEAAPFDRATAWVAGVMILLACPLGQMLTAAELPTLNADVPAMKRLDSYLIAAPLMLGAVWAIG